MIEEKRKNNDKLQYSYVYCLFAYSVLEFYQGVAEVKRSFVYLLIFTLILSFSGVNAGSGSGTVQGASAVQGVSADSGANADIIKTNAINVTGKPTLIANVEEIKVTSENIELYRNMIGDFLSSDNTIFNDLIYNNNVNPLIEAEYNFRLTAIMDNEKAVNNAIVKIFLNHRFSTDKNNENIASITLFNTINKDEKPLTHIMMILPDYTGGKYQRVKISFETLMENQIYRYPALSYIEKLLSEHGVSSEDTDVLYDITNKALRTAIRGVFPAQTMYAEGYLTWHQYSDSSGFTFKYPSYATHLYSHDISNAYEVYEYKLDLNTNLKIVSNTIGTMETDPVKRTPLGFKLSQSYGYESDNGICCTTTDYVDDTGKRFLTETIASSDNNVISISLVSSKNAPGSILRYEFAKICYSLDYKQPSEYCVQYPLDNIFNDDWSLFESYYPSSWHASVRSTGNEDNDSAEPECTPPPPVIWEATEDYIVEEAQPEQKASVEDKITDLAPDNILLASSVKSTVYESRNGNSFLTTIIPDIDYALFYKETYRFRGFLITEIIGARIGDDGKLNYFAVKQAIDGNDTLAVEVKCPESEAVANSALFNDVKTIFNSTKPKETNINHTLIIPDKKYAEKVLHTVQKWVNENLSKNSSVVKIDYITSLRDIIVYITGDEYKGTYRFKIDVYGESVSLTASMTDLEAMLIAVNYLDEKYIGDQVQLIVPDLKNMYVDVAFSKHAVRYSVKVKPFENNLEACLELWVDPLSIVSKNIKLF